MATKWTQEQLRVINQKNSNLLVAAAAGSGKTAVMVERIVSRVLDPKDPVDIDRIVVVTFTRAAAAQMKERIGNALAAALREDTDKKAAGRIRSQMALLDNAVICTIDSFCSYILRNYFNSIDLDPAFRIGDEGELMLMMSDAADEIIEDAYEKASPDFIAFVEAFLPGKSDRMLSDWMIGLYTFAQSHPFPEEWLKQCREWYRIETPKQFENSPPVLFALRHVKKLLSAALAEHERVLERLSAFGGIEKYIPAFESDCVMLERACGADSYDAMRRYLDMDFKRLANAPKEADETLKKYAQETRKRLKAQVEKLRQELFYWTAEENLDMIQAAGPCADAFIDLVLRFTQEYDDKKREGNILSFSDVEHLALKILLNKDGESLERTFAAKELAALYEEIYIDEYQDSNMVQELILTSISNGRNMFMVGDIKQSIYSFRQADPGIFLRKYESYAENAESGNVLIRLHKNFRSRENVLFCINDIFSRIMHADLGGVEYDKDAELAPGREFDEAEEAVLKEHSGGDRESTELLLCGMEELTQELPEDEEETKKRTLLARSIASRIWELVVTKPYFVHDESLNQGKGGSRPAKYSDIVILLRSANIAGPEYAEILKSSGIPAICNTSYGYFTAREVTEILNFLRVIDNPEQDIALAGALRSYFCYMSAEELARMRSGRPKQSLYQCVLMEAEEDNASAQKLRHFLELLCKYRKMAAYMPIHELVRSVIYDTGYIVYAAAMENARQREANLDMLVNKAKEYENTSFHGLFSFLRYIDKIQKYEIDTGEADVFSENDNVVRIMSIHKSKGLEFPIVFVGDMDKRYNFRDANERINFHAEYGIAMDYVDTQSRIRKKTFLKRAVAEAGRLNIIGEELRVLYVALTRASEKLILAGAVSDVDKAVAGWTARGALTGGDYGYVYAACNYLDLAAPAFFATGKGRFECIRLKPSDVAARAREKFSSGNPDAAPDTLADKFAAAKRGVGEADSQILTALRERFDFVYAHEAAVHLPGKFSVSELKHAKIEESEEEAVQIVQNEERKPVLRLAGQARDTEISSEEKNIGAERGNAYHKVFELFDYSLDGSFASIAEFIDRLAAENKLSAEYKNLVNPRKYELFLKTSLGMRMKRAALSGKLYRERQFITGFPASRIRREYEGCEDIILLQGIIDCYFEEEDGIVIVDYKTDRVTEENAEEILTKRYKEQLRLYRDAVAQITGKRVKECVIYSVSVNREIKV